jgi:meso-butanediol dehydrogenase / (S,S)-butanediol dehydrogenase / diacetyl reductase
MISDMLDPEPSNPPIALVTGGGTGIGAATARTLREAGWEVVVCGRRPDPLKAVADDCGAVPFVADIAQETDCDALVAEVTGRCGRLDGLVLNAGIQRAGTIETLPAADFDAIFDVNVRAPFLLLQRALPHLLKTRGAIVSVASVAALRSAEGMAAYGASKAALVSLTQNVGVEYGPRGVRANVVCPGWTRTELADREMTEIGEPRGLGVDASYGLATSLVPLRRPARSDEAADVIAWLLSPRSSYVNAAVIPVDGGHIALDPGTVPFDTRVRIT